MKTFTVEVGPEQPNGGRIRRSYLSKELAQTPAEGVETVYDILNRSAEKYADKRAFGFRKVEAIIEEEKEVVKVVNGEEIKEKKTWNYFQLSGYNYITYKQASRLTHDIGAGLISLGLKEHSKVEIFSPTNMYWLVTAHGCFTQNMCIVTAYDTLGEDGLLHSMNETEVEAIYTVGDLLPVVQKVSAKCPSLKYIIYSGEVKSEDLEKVRSSVSQRIVSLDELAKIGRLNPQPPKKPTAEDLCCIMYTSGSTGNPKGVILAHKNIVAAAAGCNLLLGKLISTNDSMIAYLPLAHVLEFVVENICIFWGVTLGYGAVRTLTDASVRNCKGDVREFRPTLMTGVPQVWESIRKGVLAKIAQAPPNTQKIFNKALVTKAWLLDRRLPTGFIDAIVFNKIKDQVGGRLRFALSGGASVSVETQKFLSVALCPILGGFGMTESCGMCCVMSPEQFAYGEVGAPVPCCEVKLVDVPEANYFSTNKPKPQGEVWVRGGSITQGYWKREDVTKETLTEDGWLQTGDIAEWNENGTLTIIDRKKNLVKLSNGEYIAIEKLESIYKSNINVINLCVYAESLYARPVALALVTEPVIRKLADEEKITGAFEELCANETIKNKVLKSIIETGKAGGLKGSEILFDIHLCHEEWTTESGLLTAAQKIKRPDFNKKFKAEFAAMNAKQKP